MLRRSILDALRAKYEAEIAEADTIANIYLENSVGIGEHPQHLEEVNKQILPLKNKAEELIGSVDSVMTIVTAVLNKNTRENFCLAPFFKRADLIAIPKSSLLEDIIISVH